MSYIDGLCAECHELKEQLNQLDAEIQKLESKKEEYNNMKDGINGVKENLNSADSSVNVSQEYATNIADTMPIKNGVKELTDIKSDISSIISELDSHIRDAQTEISKIEKDLAEKRQTRERLKLQIMDLQNKIDSLASEYRMN